jgi:hypothetical protein
MNNFISFCISSICQGNLWAIGASLYENNELKEKVLFLTEPETILFMPEHMQKKVIELKNCENSNEVVKKFKLFVEKNNEKYRDLILVSENSSIDVSIINEYLKKEKNVYLTQTTKYEKINIYCMNFYIKIKKDKVLDGSPLENSDKLGKLFLEYKNRFIE